MFTNQVLSPERRHVTVARRRDAEVSAVRWDNERDPGLRQSYSTIHHISIASLILNMNNFSAGIL